MAEKNCFYFKRMNEKIKSLALEFTSLVHGSWTFVPSGNISISSKFCSTPSIEYGQVYYKTSVYIVEQSIRIEDWIFTAETDFTSIFMEPDLRRLCAFHKEGTHYVFGQFRIKPNLANEIFLGLITNKFLLTFYPELIDNKEQTEETLDKANIEYKILPSPEEKVVENTREEIKKIGCSLIV